MADRFNLTAQLQLQAPTNTRQVVTQIRNQLQGINVQVDVQANTRAISQANASLQTTARQADTAARSVGTLNKNLSDAARRFGVITLATGTMLGFAQAIKRGVGEAIAFERELVKISQVTGKTVKQLQGLSQEVTRLATGLGTSSSSLLETARVLTQAGFSAEDTKGALDILAKTTLAPTFDKITDTVEGAIAVLRQFESEAAAAGGTIKFLESTLDSINAVSKSFAVESSDLIAVIRRVGGVFSSAGGSVNELIALFTSVRATTRESAETIATGLRTIFTRIQRTETVAQLEQLGIQLRDTSGNFVGAYEAVRRLSVGLSSIDPRNYRFSEIVESLGGFRQIGKVIPLIQQFTVAQDALNVAQGASGSVASDAATAQQSLAVQATKVREEFAALLRKLTDSKSFRSIASGALELARAFIRIAEALEPLLPLITSFLALKIGQGLAPGLGALIGIGGRRRQYGGVIHKFARGGFVPGSGNRDTVPAMLQPGEFVIRKSSAEKLGASTLTAMNNNRFKAGGIAQAPLVDDITQTSGSILPKPSSAIQALISAGGGAVDIDRTLKRTVGDTAYMRARTKGEQNAVLDKYFRDPNKRLQDIKSAPITQFGRELQAAVKSGSLKGSSLSIVSKSQRTPGVAEYLSQLFGIPVPNMIFTQGASKQPAMDAIRSKGPRSERVKKFFGGIIQKFEEGGTVRERLAAQRKAKLTIAPDKDLINKGVGILKLAEQNADLDTYAGAFLRPAGAGTNFIGENENLLESIRGTTGYKALAKITSGAKPGSELAQIKTLADDTIQNKYAGKNKYNLVAGGLETSVSNALEDNLLDGVVNAIQSGVSILGQELGIRGNMNTAKALKQANIDQTIGNLFESVLSFGGSPFEDTRELANAPFDFKSGLGSVAANFGIRGDISTDAKTSFTDDSLKSLMKKVTNQNALEAEAELDPILNKLASYLTQKGRTGESKAVESARKKAFGGRIGKYASGGTVDTVPSLLTPGEFVVNKKAAQSIGYGNLHRMNQSGVSKFNRGGFVGYKRFATGSVVSGSGSTAPVNLQPSNTQSSVALQKAQQAYATIIKQETQQAYAIIRANNKSVSAVTALNDARAQVLQKYSAVSLGLAQQARTGDTKAQEDLASTQRRQVNSITRAIRAQDQSIPIQDARRQAEAQVTQAWGTFYKDLQTSGNKTRTWGQVLQSTFPTFTNVAQTIKGQLQTAATAAANKLNQLAQSSNPLVSLAAKGAQGVGGAVAAGGANIKQAFSSAGVSAGAQRLDQVAGAAQQFAFLGASVAALAGQFSGLDEATSKAITETAAYSSSLIGIGGTVVQMFTSMIATGAQETTSTITNATAQQQCAGATTQNAASQSAAAKAGAGLATGFAAGAVAAVLVSSVFKFWAAEAKGQSEQFKKAADQQLQALEKGSGSVASFADNLVKSTDKAAEAKGWESAASAALMRGLGGAAVGAAIGTAFGPLGSIVGGLVGGIAGAVTGLFSYRAEIAKQQEIAAKFGATLESAATGLGTLVQAQAQFQTALQDIDAADLQPDVRVSRRLVAQSDVSGVNQSEFSSAQANLSTALFAIAKEANKSVSELTDADFQRFPQLAAIVETSRQTIAKANDGFAKDVAESRKTLAEAAKIELTGDFSLDQILKDPTNQLTQSLQAAQAAIAAETQARIASLQASFKEAKTDQERASITQQINAQQARGVQRQRDQVDALRAQSDEAVKNKKALEQSIRAQEAYRQSLERISKFTNAIVAANESLNRFEAQLDAAAALTENKALDFTSAEPAGLSDLSQVGNRKDFNRQVTNIGASLGPVGVELADKVKATSEAIERGKQNLIGQLKPGQPINAEQLLIDMGLDPSKFDPNQIGVINEKLMKAAEDNIISEEEFNDIFGPIIAEGEKAADALKQANDLQNRQIQLYGKYLDQLQAQRDKEIAAREKIIDVQTKGAELRAQARGGAVPVDQAQITRTARAQVALSGVTTAGGEQVQAGNVEQIAAAKQSAEQERKKIAAIKNSTQWETLSAAQKKKLIERDAQLINAIDKTTKELDRLSDQAEYSAALLGAIQKEAAKREAVTSIISDFVVGGNQERAGINAGLSGVQAAVSTGTLQNQTEEQRKLTVGILDKLADVNIAGAGGLTGKEVKQELVFRDAVRMGLDPSVARSLATATSKEEKLINSLDKLTKVMEAAVRGNLEQANAPVPAQVAVQPVQQQQPLRLPQGVPAPFNSGGLIQYRADGGSIFKPRGTDTVPAMLTPGEFVIKRSAVNKIGAANLAALNNGQAGVVGHAKGGVIYRAGGGLAAIDPMNAQFVGQGQRVSILSGEQYSSLLYGAIRKIGYKKLANFAQQSGYTDETVKAINTLGAANMLDPSRFRLGGGIKRALDLIVTNADMFEVIGGGGFELRMPLDGDSIDSYINKISSISQLAKSLNDQDGGELERKILDSAGYGNIVSNLTAMGNRLDAVKRHIEDKRRQASVGIPAGGILPRTFGDLKARNQGIEQGMLREVRQQDPGKRAEQLGGGARNFRIAKAEETLRNANLYFNSGGAVGDTIPAMLTPGEFVMNKQAVQKYGLPAMQSLNRGQIPGFNKGGLVGGVNYLQDGGQPKGGGTLGIDTSGIQKVFSGFLSNFSGGFDNIIQGFTGIQTVLENLTKSFSNFTMQHTVNVEGMISLGGLNVETIKQELSTSIGQMVAQEVTKRLDEQSKGFRAGT